MGDAPYLRCSDADRDRAAGVLRDCLGVGRITVEELDDRLDHVYRARTYGELNAVMGDLPEWVEATRPTPPPYPYAAPYNGGYPWPAAPVPMVSPVRRARPLIVMLVVLWLVWLGAVAGTGGAGALPVGILFVAGAVLLARRHRQTGTSRRLPPWR